MYYYRQDIGDLVHVYTVATEDINRFHSSYKEELEDGTLYAAGKAFMQSVFAGRSRSEFQLHNTLKVSKMLDEGYDIRNRSRDNICRSTGMYMHTEYAEAPIAVDYGEIEKSLLESLGYMEDI